VPTLVLHRTNDRTLLVEEGRYVAGLIPDAHFVELPGDDHLPFVGDQDAMLDEIEEFLIGSRRRLELDRVLATVMCARVLAAPDAKGVADAPGRIDGFYAHARKELEWFRGRCFAANPCGFVSTFDGPARAIRCASAISAAAPRFGVDCRIGLHTGECDVRDETVSGVAVDTAAQVAAHAAMSEVLVSRTVKDLVAGSGLGFEDHGKHALDGVPGDWRLFAVERRVSRIPNSYFLNSHLRP
jgi:class 3 adenylate cyclase